MGERARQHTEAWQHLGINPAEPPHPDQPLDKRQAKKLCKGLDMHLNWLVKELTYRALAAEQPALVDHQAEALDYYRLNGTLHVVRDLLWWRRHAKGRAIRAMLQHTILDKGSAPAPAP